MFPVGVVLPDAEAVDLNARCRQLLSYVVDFVDDFSIHLIEHRPIRVVEQLERPLDGLIARSARTDVVIYFPVSRFELMVRWQGCANRARLPNGNGCRQER